MKCLICNKDCASNSGLGRHIRNSHNMSTQEYYDKFYYKNATKRCKICNRPTKFINLIAGYTLGCCTEHTNLIRYGIANPYQSDEIKQRIKQTKLSKYGDENYNNHKKSIDTINKKYGENVTNISQVSEIREKVHKTNIEKYGVEMPFMSQDIQQKVQNTKENRYGDAFYTNREKFYQTMKKQGFISKYEIAFEKVLQINNISYKTQYRDNVRYPYYCDFYLPDYDMFIEINGYPAHGPHSFNRNDETDINLLNMWNELALNGQEIYLDWINRWTVIDVEKRDTAKKHNLVYYELYNFEEINEFIKTVLKIDTISIIEIYQNL